jgi:muconolactone delta-isomerase
VLFKVRIKVELPGEMDPAWVQELGEAETVRGI